MERNVDSGRPGVAPGEVVLRAEGLEKVFRDFWGRPRVRALRGVDLEIRRGEVFGLLGPNGSGKSTTMKLILGLLRPSGGRVEALGRSPRDVQTKARIGYMPEDSALYRFLTAEETLDFYGRLFDLDRQTRRERVDQLLDMTGLAHARRRVVAEFSKGMTRRLGLAQALINDPDLILLDEPTSGLDPVGCRQMKDLILTLARRGRTVVLSSHLLADVEDVCDRIAILYDGTIRASGLVSELLRERNVVSLTVPAMSPDRIEAVRRRLREEVGADPAVDHPLRSLERFFLEILSQAQEGRTEPSGVAQAGRVAAFLEGRS